MNIIIPDDADMLAEVIDRIGKAQYMIAVDPVENGVQSTFDIQCAGFDAATGGIRGYRVDEEGERIGDLEVFTGVENIEVY